MVKQQYEDNLKWIKEAKENNLVCVYIRSTVGNKEQMVDGQMPFIALSVWVRQFQLSLIIFLDIQWNLPNPAPL